MIKVLMISGGLQIGGAERIAADISLYAPKDEFEFHYLVFEGIPNDYGPGIIENGGKVFTIPSPKKGYISFIKNVRNLIEVNRYDIVHCHTMFNSGIPLKIAKKMNVPCRISHSHTIKTEHKVSLLKNIYQYLMRYMILHSANFYFACGKEAGYWLFGKDKFDREGIVIRNGIDVDNFVFCERNRRFIRNQYHLGDCFVIGHTGSLFSVKNQSFLIEILPDILSIKNDTVLLLVGSGQDREMLENKARNLGVYDHIIFTGQVTNVNQFLSAFDIYAFPSLREGTPLALIEAQANGLPCIVSEHIPNDAFLTPLIQKISLDNRKRWIQCIASSQRNEISYAEEIKNKGYDVKASFKQIYDVYRGKYVG